MVLVVPRRLPVSSRRSSSRTRLGPFRLRPVGILKAPERDTFARRWIRTVQPSRPPQQYPDSSYPPHQQPPPYAIPQAQPPRRSNERLIVVVAIVVVASVIVVAVAVPAMLHAMTTPNVLVTDATYSEEYCWSVLPYISVVFTFALTNSGDADGLATVTFYQDHVVLGSQQYVVIQHSTVDKTAEFSIASCGGHTYQYVVTAVSKI